MFTSIKIVKMYSYTYVILEIVL